MNEQEMNAIHTIRMQINNREFMRNVFAAIHANTDNETIKQLALDSFVQFDEEMPELDDLGKK